ncbi:SDR family oxidoreductase [Nocardioides convexus]|uniref:SDR family oxidoreductase n=1 Tax=Nocardioides convexus TaxID=2712224 RepID=UPI0024189601|nr:SDR family oxidoreductase [Nocardioides convexus]
MIHCAARATPYAQRADYDRDNVIATQTVLEWCAALGSPRLVHVSSSSVLYRDGDQARPHRGDPAAAHLRQRLRPDQGRLRAAGPHLPRLLGDRPPARGLRARGHRALPADHRRRPGGPDPAADRAHGARRRRPHLRRQPRRLPDPDSPRDPT